MSDTLTEWIWIAAVCLPIGAAWMWAAGRGHGRTFGLVLYGAFGVLVALAGFDEGFWMGLGLLGFYGVLGITWFNTAG